MADLSAFATKDNAEEGVVIPVKIDGMKLPIALRIYGSDSDVVRQYERERIRKLGIGKNGKNEIDEDEFEELLESDEGIIVRIGGIYAYDWKKKTVIDEPTVLYEKTLGCDKKSYEYLIENLPALKDWVMEHSNDRSNFLSEGKKN